MVKLAILISGQVRPYRTSIKFIQTVLAENDVDVFLSSWTTTGLTQKLGNEQNKMGLVTDHIDVQSFTAAELFRYHEHFVDKIDHYERPSFVAAAEPIHSKYNLPNLFLMKKGLDLIQQHEKEHNCQYKFIMKIRPDIIFSKKLIYVLKTLIPFMPQRLYGEMDLLNRHTQFSDKICVGPRHLMFIYLNIIESIGNYWKTCEERNEIAVGERAVKNILDTADVPLSYLPFFCKIIRND